MLDDRTDINLPLAVAFTKILPVVVSPDFLLKIFNTIEEDSNALFEVNLNKQEFIILKTGATANFEINPYKKHCLKNGLDDIDYLVAMKNEIAAFESERKYCNMIKNL